MQPEQVSPLDLQLLMIGMAQAVRDLDLHHLAALPAERLAAQVSARWELYMYLDQIWNDLKAPAQEQQIDLLTRQSLAGPRDFAGTLCSATDHLKYRS